MVTGSVKTATIDREPTISAVDLFCGVGGLTYGLKRAGLNVLAGFDIDADCQYAFTQNTQVPFYRRDILEIESSELRSAFGSSEFKVLAGCAPCQPFSTYARTRTSNDTRWSLVKAFLRFAVDLKPDVVTMENVPQLTRHPVFKSVLRALHNAGYKVSWSIVDCTTLGVPQTRRRLVLLASRHGEIELLPAGRRKKRTVRDILEGLPKLRAGEESALDPLHRACSLTDVNLRRILASRPGGTWREWDVSLRADCHRNASGSTYPSVYARMAWDEPAPSITTQYFGFGNGRFGHPVQDRAISLREGALLQTFPRTYRFEPPGTKLSAARIGKLVGNAVPPVLAEHVGNSIRAHLRGVRRQVISGPNKP